MRRPTGRTSRRTSRRRDAGQIGVHAPRVLARNVEQGFLLVTDLGSITYLMALENRGRADALYGDALDALVEIQEHGDAHANSCHPTTRNCCGSR